MPVMSHKFDLLHLFRLNYKNTVFSSILQESKKKSFRFIFSWGCSGEGRVREIYFFKTSTVTSAKITLSYSIKVKSKYLKKELSLCHKLWFSNFNIVATQWRRPLIFQTINAVRLNNVSLKYQRFTSLRCRNIRITKVKFVAKTQLQFTSLEHTFFQISI